jgi:hypothetical protein
MKKKKKKPNFSAFLIFIVMCVLIYNPKIYVEFLQHMNNPDANQILK